MDIIYANGKRFWKFPDGTVLPVVSGGSDVLIPPAGDQPPADPDPAAFAAGAGDGLPPGADPSAIAVPVVKAPPAAPKNEPKTYTIEDIEAARKQERDKLYSRLETTDKTVNELKAERDRRIKEEADARAAAEAEAERQRVEALSAAERLAEVMAENERRWQQVEEERARERAILAKESELRQLEQYRAQRLAEVQDQIEPNLLDYIRGNSVEEIENSIALAVEKTNRIVEAAAGFAQQQRMAQRGPSVSGLPPVGPMDNNPTYETLTAADIAAMDPETYSKNRDRLMQAASQQARRGPYGG